MHLVEPENANRTETTQATINRKAILDVLNEGGAWWHWPCGIIMFKKIDTNDKMLTVSALDTEAMNDTDIWSGYDETRNIEVDARRLIDLISHTKGWMRADDPASLIRYDPIYIRLAKTCAKNTAPDTKKRLKTCEYTWRRSPHDTRPPSWLDEIKAPASLIYSGHA